MLYIPEGLARQLERRLPPADLNALGWTIKVLYRTILVGDVYKNPVDFKHSIQRVTVGDFDFYITWNVGRKKYVLIDVISVNGRKSMERINRSLLRAGNGFGVREGGSCVWIANRSSKLFLIGDKLKSMNKNRRISSVTRIRQRARLMSILHSVKMGDG